MKQPSASSPLIVRSVSLPSTEATESLATETATDPLFVRNIDLSSAPVAVPGAVDIDDLLAEFAATPKGANAVAKGRQWVADNFYSGSPSLAKMRLERGWSQAELARRAGTSQSYIGRLETGSIDPQLSTMRRLAEALGAPVAAVVDALMPKETP
ncbi:MAG: helix-turn-helix transcriptional regulator [Candidatus Accumulibacter necessarius]|jgi:DNA-binding XRE family transcriptional regulator|uniref:helix-turn-helix domain-containing protein n=1 Tax=Candidatus Accumulibacter necessarius TaxID=2954386 RepID=UPI002FC3291C